MKQALALIPASIRHLWQDAMDFIADLLEQADRDVLRAGIRRAAGAQLAIWIGGAESALRRLILIAARVLTPAPLKPPVKPQATPRTSAKPARSFSVFRLHGSGTPIHRRPPQAPRELAPYGHIRFPADPILALGRVFRPPIHCHNGGPVLPRTRAKHPLDRWGRLSRNDPDWRPPPERPFADTSCRETEADTYDLYGFEIVGRIPRPRREPSRLDSRPDWRRCYDEWEKPVSAPTFLARLDALARAIADPDALIRRTARRLQSQRDRILALARTARPATRLPRRTRRLRIDEGAYAMAGETHDAFDTS